MGEYRDVVSSMVNGVSKGVLPRPTTSRRPWYFMGQGRFDGPLRSDSVIATQVISGEEIQQQR